MGKITQGITSEQMTDKMLYEKDVFITLNSIWLQW